MNKKGFTLIELLVVVLIIGILSSVALPQYTKAVEKSRMAGVWSVLGSIRKAGAVTLLDGEIYNEDGTFNYNPQNLDVNLRCTFASGPSCHVDCPSSGWQSCQYAMQGTPENPQALFYMSDKNGTDWVEMSLGVGGQNCAGTLCSKYGLSSGSSQFSFVW